MRHLRVHRAVCVSLVACGVLIGCTSETTGSSGFARNGLVCTQGTSDVFFEAIAPSGRFDVDSSEPGVTTGFRVEFLIPMDVREAHEMVVTAPPEFGFLGFDALGAGAHIGMWEFDFDDDGVFGVAGFTIDHFALGPDTAFSDSDDSGGLAWWPTQPCSATRWVAWRTSIWANPCVAHSGSRSAP